MARPGIPGLGVTFGGKGKGKEGVGGKGLGKGGSRRHRKILRDNVRGIKEYDFENHLNSLPHHKSYTVPSLHCALLRDVNIADSSILSSSTMTNAILPTNLNQSPSPPWRSKAYLIANIRRDKEGDGG
ncbi:MAG: hypothetical protein Q9187_004850 [Circinaria calcarea]